MEYQTDLKINSEWDTFIDCLQKALDDFRKNCKITDDETIINLLNFDSE